MFFSSCDSVVGDFLEFNQANRGSLCVLLGKRNCSACNAEESGLISWGGGSLMYFLDGQGNMGLEWPDLQTF